MNLVPEKIRGGKIYFLINSDDNPGRFIPGLEVSLTEKHHPLTLNVVTLKFSGLMMMEK